MDNKTEELKDYIFDKFINQDAKLKEICSSLLEVKNKITKKVEIYDFKRVLFKSLSPTRLCLKKKLIKLMKLNFKI